MVFRSTHKTPFCPENDLSVREGVASLSINNITLQVNADSAETAKAIAEEASRKLLSNPVMEYFEVTVQ